MNLNDWAYKEVTRKVRNEKQNEINQILQAAIDKKYEEIYEIEDLIGSLHNPDTDINELRCKTRKYRINFTL